MSAKKVSGSSVKKVRRGRSSAAKKAEAPESDKAEKSVDVVVASEPVKKKAKRVTKKKSKISKKVAGSPRKKTAKVSSAKKKVSTTASSETVAATTAKPASSAAKSPSTSTPEIKAALPEKAVADSSQDKDAKPAATSATEPSKEAGSATEERPGRKRRPRGGRRRSPRRTEESADTEVTDESEDIDVPIEKDSRTRRMLINVVDVEEARVAILADKELIELNIETTGSEKYRGNIYKARVVNIKESMQAAFVNFGGEKNGFLHVSDVLSIYGGEDAGHVRKRERLIQKLLRKDQTVLVQVTKEGVGNKGPALTTYLSLPGRYAVLMPNMARSGVSRKIEDPRERSKLRDMLAKLSPPEGMGFIMRTQSLDCELTDLSRDLDYLIKLWQTIVMSARDKEAPSLLFQESDLVIRTLRDYYTPDIKEVLVDSEEYYQKAREFFNVLMPEHEERVKLYSEPEPLFRKYSIEQEIDKLNVNRVPIHGGAYLVIDQTEAMVTIDVNSGKFTNIKDAEITAFKINMSAAREIPKQLRLRDLGGLVVMDFIDMRAQKHRRDVERELRKHMRSDKARFKVLRMSQFCLVEMTRQRLKPSKQNALYTTCSLCHGTGMVQTIETMGIRILRSIRDCIHREDVEKVEATLHADVAAFLLNTKRSAIGRLEDTFNKPVHIMSDWETSTEGFMIRLHKSNGQVQEIRPDSESH